MTHSRILARMLRQLWNTKVEPDAHAIALAMGATCIASDPECRTYLFVDGSIADIDYIHGYAVGVYTPLYHPHEAAKIRNSWMG
jgi:hypothetical protein